MRGLQGGEGVPASEVRKGYNEKKEISMGAVVEHLDKIQSMESRMAELRKQREQELRKLSARIDAALKVWAELFKDQEEPEPSETMGIRFDGLSRSGIESNARLSRARARDGWVSAVFEETFRGEGHEFEIELPIRYLEEGAEEAMRADAQAIGEQRKARSLQEQERSEREERELLAKLSEKYSQGGPSRKAG